MLVGRERELGELARLVAGLQCGRSGAFVLRGPAGIGKSALLGAAQRAAGQRIRVLRAAGVTEEMGLPYAALHQVLCPLLHDLAALPEPQATALRSAFGYDRGLVDPFLVGLGTLTLLANAAAHMPLLLIVEDAHWLAGASADALIFAARRLAEVPSVGMLFASRDRPAALPANDVADMRLEPLNAASARACLRAAAPTMAESVCGRLVAEAQGNPLALVELLAALTPQQVEGSVPLPHILPLSERLRRAFLPDSAQVNWHLLLAATDDEGDLSTILRASGDDDAVTTALGFAATGGIVELDRKQVRFLHPLVRSAVYQNATVPERRAAHLSLAQAAVSGSAQQVRHLADATFGTDQAVAEALAARALDGPTDAASAVKLLRRAAELAVCPELRLRCLTDAAVSASAASDFEQAGALAFIEEANALARTERDRCRLGYLRALISDGAGPTAMSDADPWIPSLVSALAARRAWDAGETRGLVLPDVTFTSDEVPVPWRWLLGPRPHLLGLTAPDVPGHRRHVELMTAGGALARLPGALYELAAGELLTGEWSEAQLHCRQGLARCERSGRPTQAGGFHALLAWLAAVRGDIAAHHDHATAALAAAPHASTLAVTQWARGMAAMAESQVQDAFEQLRDIVTPGSLAAHDAIALFVYPDLIEVALRTGRKKEALELLAHYSEAVAASAADGGLCTAGLARATALLADDDAESAFERALATTGHAPFEQGRVRLLYGNWLRRQRQVIPAREQLRLGASQLDTLGARPWVARARAELRAAGVRQQGSRQHDDNCLTSALTPQELSIATYAARGLSNSEIAAELYLSPRTVAYHLHKVFPKLGVTSRHQLQELLALS